jgi:hypothetical protein
LGSFVLRIQNFCFAIQRSYRKLYIKGPSVCVTTLKTTLPISLPNIKEVHNNIRQRIRMRHQMTDCNEIAGSQNLCRYSPSHRKYGFPEKQSFFPSVHKLNSVDTWNKIFLLAKPGTNGRLYILENEVGIGLLYWETNRNIFKLARNYFVHLRNLQNIQW